MPPEQIPHGPAARGEAFTDELIWIGTGASQRAYSVTCRLIRNPDGHNSGGHNSGAVMASTDVTALVEALEVKVQLLASVSHELRTPLTSIHGYLVLAMDEALDPDLEDYLTVISRNTQRLLGLVEDLLATAADAPTTDPRPSDLAQVLTHSVQAARARARAAGITLSLERDPGSSVTGVFDPDRIGQAVDNLISNAIKYTPHEGSVRITAGAELRRCAARSRHERGGTIPGIHPVLPGR